MFDFKAYILYYSQKNMVALSKSQKSLKLLLQFWIISFSICTLIFLFFGNEMLQVFNSISASLSPSLPALPLPIEHFWLALSGSLMTTLIFLCYWAQKDIKNNKYAVIPVLVSKFASTFFFFLFFIIHLRALAYFLGGLIDGIVFVITFFIYRAAKSSESS